MPKHHDALAMAFDALQYGGRIPIEQTPRFRLPKAFPDNKLGPHDPVLTDAAAMHGASDHHVFEDINVDFPGRRGRAHDPNSFSYLDGSAKKVGGSLKGNGPEQGRQDPEAAGTFTGMGLLMAHRGAQD